MPLHHSAAFHTLPARRRRHGRGVTFLEIMVVVVILGVLMAVSAPTLRGVHERNKLRAASRELAALVRFARQQAVLRGHSTEVRVNAELGKYRLFLDPPEKGRRIRSSRKIERSPMEKTRYLDAKQGKILFLSIDSPTEPAPRSGAARIEFFRNGSASPTRIVIEDEKKRLMTVEIAASTGGVRVSSGEPEERDITAPASETDSLGPSL
jgi:prepilin-type N-terminal cleavage/methylation domain-containing protein